MKHFKIIFLSACFVFALGQRAVCDKIDDDIKKQSSKLLDVSKSLKDKQRIKEQLILEEKLAKSELKSISSQLAKVEAEIKKVSVDIAKSSKQLKAAERKKANTVKEKDNCEQALCSGVVEYYKCLAIVPYEANPVKYKTMQQYLEYCKQNHDNAVKRHESAQSEVKNLEVKTKKLSSKRQASQNDSKKRKELLDQKNKTLKEKSAKVAAAEREIKNLQESAKAMQALITKLSSSKQTKKGAAAPKTNVRKNSLPWPVLGKTTANFGRSKHPTLNTYVISNGIKIQGSDNSQVKAVEAGTVIFAGAFRSYGKMVIVDHGKGFLSVYGQLSVISVKEDQTIARGAQVGRLGKNPSNVLYFEVRENNTPANPILWLAPK
jgi:septal ring factor EnvC (AmiA/AmiB activator)